MPEVLVTAGAELLLVDSPVQELLEVAIQGPPGAAAFVSAEAGNALSLGADSGLYAPYPQLASAQW